MTLMVNISLMTSYEGKSAIRKYDVRKMKLYILHNDVAAVKKNPRMLGDFL